MRARAAQWGELIVEPHRPTTLHATRGGADAAEADDASLWMMTVAPAGDGAAADAESTGPAPSAAATGFGVKESGGKKKRKKR